MKRPKPSAAALCGSICERGTIAHAPAAGRGQPDPMNRAALGHIPIEVVVLRVLSVGLFAAALAFTATDVRGS